MNTDKKLHGAVSVFSFILAFMINNALDTTEEEVDAMIQQEQAALAGDLGAIDALILQQRSSDPPDDARNWFSSTPGATFGSMNAAAAVHATLELHQAGCVVVEIQHVGPMGLVLYCQFPPLASVRSRVRSAATAIAQRLGIPQELMGANVMVGERWLLLSGFVDD